MIYNDTLKPCKLTNTAELTENKELEMHLAVREAKSAVVHDMSSKGYSLLYNSNSIQFSRITVASDHISILKEELNQLESALTGLNLEEESDPVTFISAAIKMQEKKLSICKEVKQLPILTTEETKEYMYQIKTGENIYLHPVNFKCLQDQFKEIKEMPKILRGRLLEAETQHLTAGLKKKYSYLNHLPLNSTFTFVELDLKDILKPDILMANLKILEERKEHREKEKEKEKEEKKEKEISSEPDKKRDYLDEYPYVPIQNEEIKSEPKLSLIKDVKEPVNSFLSDIDLISLQQASKKRKKKPKFTKK